MRNLIGHLARAKDPGLLAVGLVCFVVAAALVTAPLGWAAAGVSFVVMDLALTEPNGDGR